MANISALSQPLIHPEIQRTENAGIYQTSKSNEIINGVTAVDIFILIRDTGLWWIFTNWLLATAAASVLRCSWGALGTWVSGSRKHSWFLVLCLAARASVGPRAWVAVLEGGVPPLQLSVFRRHFQQRGNEFLQSQEVFSIFGMCLRNGKLRLVPLTNWLGPRNPAEMLRLCWNNTEFFVLRSISLN